MNRWPSRPLNSADGDSLHHLEKSYLQGVHRTYALRQVTADIEQGEFVSNAAGTTIIQVMAT